MTPGERSVWAAAYGASFSHLMWERDVGGKLGRSLQEIAKESAERAVFAVEELRAIANCTGDFQEDAFDVIHRHPRDV